MAEQRDRETAIAVLIVRIFVVAVFAVIAAVAVYMGRQAWEEMRVHTSDAAQTGVFFPEHCDTTATQRNALALSAHGEEWPSLPSTGETSIALTRGERSASPATSRCFSSALGQSAAG